MNMKTRVILGFALVFGVVGIAMNVLSYPEITDEDIFEADETEQLFAAANAECPLSYDSGKPVGRGLFPDGFRDIGPAVPVQNQICDCRFVATLSSLASTEAGRQAIFNMAAQQSNGNTIVTFPGAKTEPVTVAPITAKEALVVSYVWKDGACVPNASHVVVRTKS